MTVDQTNPRGTTSSRFARTADAERRLFSGKRLFIVAGLTLSVALPAAAVVPAFAAPKDAPAATDDTQPNTDDAAAMPELPKDHAAQGDELDAPAQDDVEKDLPLPSDKQANESVAPLEVSEASPADDAPTEVSAPAGPDANKGSIPAALKKIDELDTEIKKNGRFAGGNRRQD